MPYLLLIFCLFFSLTMDAQERIHFLIPGGAGGGWDTTARGIGEAMVRANLISSVSYENLSGGDGSKAIAHLIETAKRQSNTLMISSTPIILRSLKGIFPQSYKDLTPVAAAIADYGAFVVKNDSKYQTWHQVINDFKQDPRNVKIAGGSVRGGMDHLVAALAFKQSGCDAKQLRYIPYNAGGKAMVGLLSGETQLLSTGLSEALALAEQGEVRVLSITSDKRLPFAPTVPTLKEQGIDVSFVNWRGFFAAPNISIEKIKAFEETLIAMYATSEWKKVRQQRGWTDYFIANREFNNFLAKQETSLANIMIELGFLKASTIK